MTETFRSDIPPSGPPADNGPGKAVPAETTVRDAIRRESRAVADGACHRHPLDRGRLEQTAADMLRRLDLAPEYLGFAMVAVGTEFWREAFASTPYDHRLMLLPHCLHRVDHCRGTYGPDGLACARCGACDIASLQQEAQSLGYKVLVAEGTPAVVRTLATTPIAAILGVACLDSLDKCFNSVAELGLPYAGVPLLRNGCVETEVETDLVRELMRRRADGRVARPPGYAGLLSAAVALFEDRELGRLLHGHVSAGDRADDPVARAEAVALDWLRRGGKRFRPFITLASYAAIRGAQEGADVGSVAERLPDAAKSVAVAMELFHKASLVHDDVEDNDAYRYGQPTIHARYGSATAINTGDYLLGLGYRLVASQMRELGAECVTDVLAALSDAHVRLSRGQGAELLLTGDGAPDARPEDVLAMYALKTAPAFYAAMVVGMRMAAPLGPQAEPIAAFCRHMGVAYQVLDDLSDLDDDPRADQVAGQDLVGRRPTILRAFAQEAGCGPQLASILCQSGRMDRGELVAEVRRLYDACGALARACKLVDKCRCRAHDIAESTEPPSLRDLLLFLLRMVLNGHEPGPRTGSARGETE